MPAVLTNLDALERATRDAPMRAARPATAPAAATAAGSGTPMGATTRQMHAAAHGRPGSACGAMQAATHGRPGSACGAPACLSRRGSDNSHLPSLCAGGSRPQAPGGSA
eukprot:6871538-Prymnesium_polylepis.1